MTLEVPDRGTHEFLVIERNKFPVELTESTTAQAVMCRMLVIPKGDDLAHKGFALCLKRLPTWTLKGTIDVAYWTYASVAAGLLRKARPPEKAAQAWFEALHKAVLPPQKSDGSWDPVGTYGHAGGRVYTTAMLARALSAPYLYGKGLAGRVRPSKAHRKAVSALYAVSRNDPDEGIRELAKAVTHRLRRDKEDEWTR